MTLDREKNNLRSRMQERNYLAHELHDSLAQTLASVRYHIRNLDHAIQGGDECEIYELLEMVENNVEIAHTELRHLISKFRTPIEDENLISGIENSVRKFGQETGIHAVFQNMAGEVDVSPFAVSQAVRIVRESLVNIRKHAEADTVRVMIRCENDTYRVLIEDDGVGFDVNSDHCDRSRHFGLNVMAERAGRIHGELSIDSARNEGTRVCLTFCDENAFYETADN